MSSQSSVENFLKELESLYNFDALLNIIEPFQPDQRSLETVNTELTEFIQQVNSQKMESANIQEKAKDLYNFNEEPVRH